MHNAMLYDVCNAMQCNAMLCYTIAIALMHYSYIQCIRCIYVMHCYIKFFINSILRSVMAWHSDDRIGARPPRVSRCL